MLNRLPILLAVMSLFIGLASATSNTVFTENGLPPATQWTVDVYSFTSNSVNLGFTNTTNSVGYGQISTNATPAGTYYIFATTPSYGFASAQASITAGGSYNVIFLNTSVVTLNTIIITFCLTLQQAGQGTNPLCVPYVGNPSAGSQQSQIFGAPYSANLTIFINPYGAYQYIITNGSSNGKAAQSVIDPQFYANIAPTTLLNPESTFTTCNGLAVNCACSSSTSNVTGSPCTLKPQPISATYIGSIYSSQMFDISPMEYAQVSASLTPYTFFHWIQQNSALFTNATLLYVVTPQGAGATIAYTTGGIVQSTIGFFGTILSLISCGEIPVTSTVVPFSACKNVAPSVASTSRGITTTLNLGKTTIENSTPITQAVRISFDQMPSATKNYQLYVSYEYPCQNLATTQTQIGDGLCIQSGISGMQGFNNYVDSTFSPQIYESNFLNDALPALLSLTMVAYILKKMNGN